MRGHHAKQSMGKSAAASQGCISASRLASCSRFDIRSRRDGCDISYRFSYKPPPFPPIYVGCWAVLEHSGPSTGLPQRSPSWRYAGSGLRADAAERRPKARRLAAEADDGLDRQPKREGVRRDVIPYPLSPVDRCNLVTLATERQDNDR